MDDFKKMYFFLAGKFADIVDILKNNSERLGNITEIVNTAYEKAVDINSKSHSETLDTLKSVSVSLENITNSIVRLTEKIIDYGLTTEEMYMNSEDEDIKKDDEKEDHAPQINYNKN